LVEELLLGDNPFIGVSHLTQEKAREETGEASLENKVAVFEAAVRGGATGFVFSTHKSNLELLAYLKTHRRDLLNAMNYYVLLPYAQSYVRRANVGGTPRLLRSSLSSIMHSTSATTDIAAALATLRPERLAGLFIKLELAPYLEVLPKEKVKTVLLHEILTDPAAAFHLVDLLKFLDSYVRKRIGISFGLHTKNFGVLHRRGFFTEILPEYIMTSINPLGYMMAPSKEVVEESIEDLGAKTKIIAINVLASGATKLDDATEYLSRFKDRIYAVSSASSKPHRICENFQTIRLRLGKDHSNSSRPTGFEAQIAAGRDTKNLT